MSRLRGLFMLLGIIGILAGGYFLVTAHVAKPVEVDGTLQHYREYTSSSGSYDHTEIILNEAASKSYTFNKNDFTPKLPDSAYKNGQVNLWVDQGTTNVLAITFYDENDQNPTKYTTNYYNNPQKMQSDQYTTGGIFGGLGVVLLVVGFLIRGKKPTPAVATVAASTLTPPAQH